MMEILRAAVLGQKLGDSPDLPDGQVPPTLVLRRGRLIPLIGGLLAGMNRSAAAVTLRRTIIVAPDVELTPRLLAHELAHVRQWEADWLFPLRYSLATLRHGYRDNPYEVEAREVEASVRRAQSGEDTTEWRWRDPS
ncbi:MAG: DUF4157 domain-containing protein [Gemmatimonadota bacterium]